MGETCSSLSQPGASHQRPCVVRFVVRSCLQAHPGFGATASGQKTACGNRYRWCRNMLLVRLWRGPVDNFTVGVSRCAAPGRRKAQYSWRYTFVFVRRKDYDDSLVVCHSWPRYPRGNPDACTKKNTRDHEPAPSSSLGGIAVRVAGAEILETWSISLWCFRRCWSLGCGQNPHNFHNQNS